MTEYTFKISNIEQNNNQAILSKDKDWIELHWNGSSIKFNSIEDAKTAALIMFRIVMEAQ